MEAIDRLRSLLDESDRVVAHQDILLRRAAELLSNRAPFLPDMNNRDWFEQRDQWLRDAGMEK